MEREELVGGVLAVSAVLAAACGPLDRAAMLRVLDDAQLDQRLHGTGAGVMLRVVRASLEAAGASA